MTEKENYLRTIMETLDKEIFEKLKKIVEKEAKSGKLEELLDYDYYMDDEIIVEIPVTFKTTEKDHTISKSYFVELNININNHG